MTARHRCRLFTLGESLGGVKSLVCHPARMAYASIPADQRAALGRSDRLIRLSPGIEHATDLIDDLHEGLARVSWESPESSVAGLRA